MEVLLTAMCRSRIISVTLLALILASPLPFVGEGRAQVPFDLIARLDALLADGRLAGAQVAIIVRDAATGDVLYARNPDALLVPGSNQKLLVAAAAFAVLGPEYRFRTAVLTSGRQRGDTLDGHLYLKGTGDPTMLADRYADLAAALASRGIRLVRGRLVADDTWFDGVRLGPDWSWDDEPFAFAAQVSALTVAPDEEFDAGTIIVDLHPGPAEGLPARVVVSPVTRYVTILNKVLTGAAGSTDSVAVNRQHGTNTILLAGKISADRDRIRRWVSVWEPTGYAVDLFRESLARYGVRVEGSVTFGPTPPFATELAAVDSLPLARLAVPFLKLSNNGIAEVLLKAMGRHVFGDGSWRAGLQVVTDSLVRRGADRRAIRLRDGSGLSRLNLISARELTNLLVEVQREPWFGFFYDALPIAGVPDRLIGGTLCSRMRGTSAQGNLRAKTGTLTSVTALSGFVTSPGRGRLVFSSLINNFVEPGVREIEDAVGVTLAGLGSER